MADKPVRRNDLVRATFNPDIVGTVEHVEEPQPGKELVTISPFGDGDRVRVSSDLVEVADT